jgi:Mn-dependent DtxR family transcriptional regulator
MAGRQPSALGSTTAVEDYLEQILALMRTKGYARVIDIAAGLGISQASVTNMIQRLDAEGLLKYENYRGIVLTEAGEQLAVNITERHQILADFLSLFDLEEASIHHDVEGMEHHVSPGTLAAIRALTAELKAQPALLARVIHAASEIS